MKYESRFEAGKVLASYLEKTKDAISLEIRRNPKEWFCFAIPNGGVSIAEGFCSTLNIQYDILIVRKIKIPWNTEAGFGSVTPDGTVLYNESLLTRLNLTQHQIDESTFLTKNEIRERLKIYNKDYETSENYDELIQSKKIFLTDDGLASGFTMLAAISMLKKHHAEKIYVAVPTAPLHTVRNIESKINDVICPNIKNTSWFAVADAYRNWYDVSDSEVLEILTRSNNYAG